MGARAADLDLDHGEPGHAHDGIEVVVLGHHGKLVRRRYGRDLPAILLTADRSAHVREEARASGIHILNKPVKPASLRALITQWRVQRVAAE